MHYTGILYYLSGVFVRGFLLRHTYSGHECSIIVDIIVTKAVVVTRWSPHSNCDHILYGREMPNSLVGNAKFTASWFAF